MRDVVTKGIKNLLAFLVWGRNINVFKSYQNTVLKNFDIDFRKNSTKKMCTKIQENRKLFFDLSKSSIHIFPDKQTAPVKKH